MDKPILILDAIITPNGSNVVVINGKPEDIVATIDEG